jgi:hypothetical protein
MTFPPKSNRFAKIERIFEDENPCRSRASASLPYLTGFLTTQFGRIISLKFKEIARLLIFCNGRNGCLVVGIHGEDANFGLSIFTSSHLIH